MKFFSKFFFRLKFRTRRKIKNVPYKIGISSKKKDEITLYLLQCLLVTLFLFHYNLEISVKVNVQRNLCHSLIKCNDFLNHR